MNSLVLSEIFETQISSILLADQGLPTFHKVVP